MSNYEIIEKEPIAGIEVLNELTKRAKETELTYREEKTKDYLKKNTKLKISDFKKAKDELTALEIDRLEEEQIIKILEVLPKDGTGIRAIVSHSGTVLVDENVDKILKVLKSYSKK